MLSLRGWRGPLTTTSIERLTADGRTRLLPTPTCRSGTLATTPHYDTTDIDGFSPERSDTNWPDITVVLIVSWQREDDPEFGEAELPDGTTNRGRDGCSSCENGFVLVNEAYAERMVPPLPLMPAGTDPAVIEALERERGARLAAYANSVYPCKNCHPHLFARWAAGHLEPSHDSGECELCSNRKPRRGRADKPEAT